MGEYMGSILEFPLEDCFKMKVILILALVAVTAAFGSDDNYILSDEFIAEINSKAKTWTAGRNFDVKTPRTRFLGMMGVHPNNHLSLPPLRDDNYTEEQLKDIPAEFDPRVEWPMCDSISMIWDQGGCGSCWAFGTANAMSDRVCIHSPNNNQVLVSPNEILACCNYCGFGCNGYIHLLPGPTGTNPELFPVVCTEILKLANPTLRNHANTTLMEIDQTVAMSQPQDARNSAKIVTQLNSWRTRPMVEPNTAFQGKMKKSKWSL